MTDIIYMYVCSYVGILLVVATLLHCLTYAICH